MGDLPKQCKRYGMIFLGCLIGSLGFNLFLIPAHLLSGGISGIAIVLYYIAQWPVGIQLLVYNLPILYLANHVFGRRYAVDTIIGTVLFSACIDLTSFTVQYELVKDVMLNAIFGGVFAGIGFGLVFRSNANTGGLDVVGAVVKKYYSFDMGSVIFVLNVIIVAISAVLFNLEAALFTLVSIYMTAELTNRVAAGFNREKSVIIISPEAEKIANMIITHVHRGVTFVEGRGAFSREHKNILFTVISLTQVSKVKTIVDRYDPMAFMIVSSASEVMGRGFTMENQLMEAQKQRLLELGSHEEGTADNDRA